MNPSSNPQTAHKNKEITNKKQQVNSFKPEQNSSQKKKLSNGLNEAQQHFVLKFCRQLASVIQACEQSETAEIEIGRRRIGAQQVRVKLQAKREPQ